MRNDEPGVDLVAVDQVAQLPVVLLNVRAAQCPSTGPLKKNVPKSNPNFPSLANSSAAEGSCGTNTPTTPIRPVGRTAAIRLLIVRPGASSP